jgi:oligopeptide transport system substrate-binding protein
MRTMGKTIALLMATLMVMTVLSACGQPAQPEKEEKVFRTYITVECPILNGHDSVESVLQTPHDYCSSPLYRVYPDEDGQGYHYIADLADGMPVKVDDLNWQIKIRKEAKWQNGEPINADTIVYSWKMLLDPILANQMADFLSTGSISIVNAKAYQLQGTDNTVKWEDVGIKKVDDYTIQITTEYANTEEEVCGQFVDRSTFPVYQPYYDKGMNDTKTQTTYGTTLDEWMGCGPYFFKTWEFGNLHVYEKNPDHWLADLFKYDKVEVYVVPDMNARVQLWESGKLDYFVPDATTIDKYINDPRMVSYDSLSVDHIDINCKNPANPISGLIEYRKAIYHAIDRETLGRDIYGYMKPSGTYVNGQAGILSPEGLLYRESEYGKRVTDLVNSWGPHGYNPEMALDYMNQAFTKAGLSDTDVVTLQWIYEASETEAKAAGEFLQEQFGTIFEGMVKLEVVSTAGMSATQWKKTGDDKWDLSPNLWTRSLSRKFPYMGFYYYLSTYGTAPNNYFDAEFDAQYAVCDDPAIKGDYEKILEETEKLERIYLDKVIHVPTVQRVVYEMFSERVKLPVQRYVPGLGWGTIYGEIIE